MIIPIKCFELITHWLSDIRNQYHSNLAILLAVKSIVYLMHNVSHYILNTVGIAVIYSCLNISLLKSIEIFTDLVLQDNNDLTDIYKCNVYSYV